MYVVNNNNCWFTNVGEAFIDIGVKSIINNIAAKHSEIKFAAISPMSNYYLNAIGYRENKKYNAFDPTQWLVPDVCIFAGMYGTAKFADSHTLEIARNIKRAGGKIAFLGFGAEQYDDKERNVVIKVLEELKPLLLVTRDEKTYMLYKDYVDCIKGLDCAFWVNDDYMPVNMKSKKYVVSTFNRSDETDDVACMDNLIHPWHMQYSLDNKKTRYLSKKNLMISDSPYEYLTLYANADRVYTDLVHATVASLAYGTPVKYYQIDERRDVFESLEYLKYDNEGFMSVDMDELNKEKIKIETYVCKKILGLK